MALIDTNTEAGIVGGSYPDLGFAFNPLPVAIETTESAEIRIEASFQGNAAVSIVRNTFKGKDGTNNVVFDLSGIARSFFDRDEFCLVRKKKYILLDKRIDVRMKDEELYKQLNFKIIVKDNVICEASVPIIWGALQIGETYTQSKKLTAFRGYPFSFSLFSAEAPENIIWRSNGDGFEEYTNVLQAGKHNLNIDTFLWHDDVRSVDFVIDKGENYSPFDYTFDYTFRGFGVDSVKIKIDVEDDCDDEACYLRWINRWGEWNYYLFHRKSESSQTTDNSVQFDSYFTTVGFDSVGYHPGTGGSIGKTVKQTIGLYASLVNSDTFDFLSQLVQSPVVDLFMGYADDMASTERWVNVKTQAGTFAKSSDHLQDFEFNLIMPETFTANL
ncbi:MAG: hypothetical protein ACK5MK_12540 [Dysgonomonas sp.]